MAKLKEKIESLLFISTKPLSLKKISAEVDAKHDDVKETLRELMAEYSKKGIRIMKIGSEYQMSTSPEATEIVKSFLKDEMTGELTVPALETLTIIAYRGPISKPELEQIRGVNCSLILRNLMIKGLVESKNNGECDEPLYSVTFNLLRHLGISKVEELPSYDKLSKSETIRNMLNLSNEENNEQISV